MPKCLSSLSFRHSLTHTSTHTSTHTHRCGAARPAGGHSGLGGRYFLIKVVHHHWIIDATLDYDQICLRAARRGARAIPRPLVFLDAHQQSNKSVKSDDRNWMASMFQAGPSERDRAAGAGFQLLLTETSQPLTRPSPITGPWPGVKKFCLPVCPTERDKSPLDTFHLCRSYHVQHSLTPTPGPMHPPTAFTS